MTDCFTAARRSEIMARIHSRGNQSTELRFAHLLRAFGIRGWRRNSTLPGKPDFVFRNQRVAVFIDGDFWHSNPSKRHLPRSNRAYWRRKLASNRRRDRIVTQQLRGSGWRVIRIWESDLQKDRTAASALRKVVRALGLA